MKKFLALIASGALMSLVAAAPTHAAAPTAFTDATGDVVNTTSATAPAAGAVAATDILALTLTPKAKSVQIAWTLPLVDTDPNGDYAQSFIAAVGKAPKAGDKPTKMFLVNVNNMDRKVKTMGTAGVKENCRGAKATLAATTVTARVPFTCLPGWVKRKTIFGGQVLAADANGLYSDTAGDWDGIKP